ncbi:hypothetical protein ABZ345_45530 [Lentzea sp. NPDC005914]|uniref:hypothetical protein n=1 Tax=Lentzea sp. NPDC005914 TaxID=3154572 RepID=UPI00340221FB
MTTGTACNGRADRFARPGPVQDDHRPLFQPLFDYIPTDWSTTAASAVTVTLLSDRSGRHTQVSRTSRRSSEHAARKPLARRVSLFTRRQNLHLAFTPKFQPDRNRLHLLELLLTICSAATYRETQSPHEEDQVIKVTIDWLVNGKLTAA